jgi:ankyrin repeat protein
MYVPDRGRDALMWACYGGHIEAVKWLTTLGIGGPSSARSNAAFISACARGNLELAQWLLRPDASTGVAPLGAAVDHRAIDDALTGRAATATLRSSSG